MLVRSIDELETIVCCLAKVIICICYLLSVHKVGIDQHLD